MGRLEQPWANALDNQLLNSELSLAYALNYMKLLIAIWKHINLKVQKKKRYGIYSICPIFLKFAFLVPSYLIVWTPIYMFSGIYVEFITHSYAVHYSIVKVCNQFFNLRWVMGLITMIHFHFFTLSHFANCPKTYPSFLNKKVI